MPKFQVTINDKVYAWTDEISEHALKAQGSKQAAKKAVMATAYGLTLTSFLLGVVFAFISGVFLDVFTMSFWFTPSAASFFLSLALLLGAFVFAHQIQSQTKVTPMPKAMDEIEPEIQAHSSSDVTNIGDFFDEEAKEAIDAAYQLAKRFKHAKLEPLHLFIGAIGGKAAAVVFSRLGIEFDAIKDSIGNRLASRQTGEQITVSDATEKALVAAFVNAYMQRRSVVSGLEVFFEAYLRDEFIQEVFFDQGVPENRLTNMVEWIRIHDKMREQYQQARQAAAFKPTGAMNRAMTSVATPMLDAVSEDLTTAAVRGNLPMMIGREQEVQQIMRIIEGGRQSTILVGAEGVGKTTLLAGIAQLMVEERVPQILQDKRLVRISVPHLISGATPAVAQQRLLEVLSEVVRSGNIILAISDIEQITGISQGGDQTADLASTLVDFLQRSGTFVIATTTPQAYAAAIERSVLGRVFQKVDILEPDQNDALQVLESKVGAIEYENNVMFTFEALEKAVQLSDRYMHESFLPKKAIGVAREVALEVARSKGQNASVTGEDVAHVVSQKTNIPLTNVKEEEKDKLLNLEKHMHERMVGQEEAVKSVAAALRRARTNLKSDARPIATFLFLGPTGVGKTELAKTIAETYFGSETSMVRADMSEYQDTQSIHRLIGAPGSDQGGLLTEAVRKNPFSIVLLDEFEKASPEILNLFLQVFDDGRLTDAAGRTIDFTNAILIATSNAGSQYIQDAVAKGEQLETIKTTLIEEELKTTYRPELLNRFDGVIVFKPLSQEEVGQIARLMMNQVAKRLEPKGIFFRAEDDAVAAIAEQGYDPKFGARPLRRVIQERVDDAIANVLLQGEVRRRDTIVLEKDGIRIEKGKEL